MADELPLENCFKRKATEEATDFKEECEIELLSGVLEGEIDQTAEPKEDASSSLARSSNGGNIILPSDSDLSSLTTAIRCDETLLRASTEELPLCPSRKIHPNARSPQEPPKEQCHSIIAKKEVPNLSVVTSKQGRTPRQMNLDIEVVDETALIQSPSVIVRPNPSGIENAGSTGKKKRSRGRRGRRGKKSSHNKKEVPNLCYSTKKLLVLRFVNMETQRELWSRIYSNLGPLVSKEYDSLQKKQAPTSILGVAAARKHGPFKIYVH